MNENKIAVLDIETTYFLKKDNTGGSIVEIGISELNLDNGEIKPVFDSLCRESIFNSDHWEYLDYVKAGKTPPRDAKGWIFANSSMTPEDVLNAPHFETIRHAIQDILDRYILGCSAFNKSFDFRFLKSRGFSIIELPCPMQLATKVCKLPYKSKRKGFKPPNVEEAFEFFFPGSEYVELHRASDDSYYEAKIVYELFKLGIFKVDGYVKN